MAFERSDRVVRQHLLTDRLLGLSWLPIPPRPRTGMGDSARQPVKSSAVTPTTRPAYQRNNPPAARPVDQPDIRPAGRPRPQPTPPVQHQKPAGFTGRPSALEPARPTRGLTGSLALPEPYPRGDTPADKRSGDIRLQMLESLDTSEVRSCTLCDLHVGRTQTVFGEGSPLAELMFIGEGPGEQEDKLGRPFVGPAGELLDKMITAMGLLRQDVYITNVVKCRPPGNRPPSRGEAQMCNTYLLRQIHIIRPRVIVTLGGSATTLILNTSMGITALRGRWHDFTTGDDQGQLMHIPVMPTFHPSYVLRAYTADNRKKVWNDLQQVMAYLKQAPSNPTA